MSYWNGYDPWRHDEDEAFFKHILSCLQVFVFALALFLLLEVTSQQEAVCEAVGATQGRVADGAGTNSGEAAETPH
jgi:hypothetical protein